MHGKTHNFSQFLENAYVCVCVCMFVCTWTQLWKCWGGGNVPAAASKKLWIMAVAFAWAGNGSLVDAQTLRRWGAAPLLDERAGFVNCWHSYLILSKNSVLHLLSRHSVPLSIFLSIFLSLSASVSLLSPSFSASRLPLSNTYGEHCHVA